MRRQLFFAVIVLLVTGSLDAAVPILSGNESGFWDSHALVVAEVQDAKSDKSGNRFDAKLLAVGPTTFLVPSQLTIDYVPMVESALPNVKPGTTVLLCVEKKKQGWTLPTSGLSFMPSSNAVQVVSGPDDPKVSKTVARTRALLCGNHK